MQELTFHTLDVLEALGEGRQLQTVRVGGSAVRVSSGTLQLTA